jgi:hypothetical protein
MMLTQAHVPAPVSARASHVQRTPALVIPFAPRIERRHMRTLDATRAAMLAQRGIFLAGVWYEYVCQPCCDELRITWDAARWFPLACERHDPTICRVCAGVGHLPGNTPCRACATLGEVIPSPAIFAQQIIEIQGAQHADLASVRWLADAIDAAARIEQWDRDAWLEVFDAVAYWRDLYVPDAEWWDHAARRCLKRITAMLAREVTL